MSKTLYVNDSYIPYLHAPQFLQIFFGGSSSGKSFFLAQRCIMDVCDGYNYLVCRSVAATLRRSTFNQIVQEIGNLGLAPIFSINRSDMTITNIRNNAQILFAGLDDVEKLKSITPRTGVIEAIWIEEATEVKRGAYLQLTKRLRGISRRSKKIILSFNPILKTHWIYDEFFKDCWDETRTVYYDDRKLILKTIYKDNHFLTEDDVYNLEHEKDDYFRNVYTFGNWGVLGDVIYRNWIEQDLSKLIPHFDNIYNGLDFGFTNPSAGIRIHVSDKAKKIYVFQEYYRRKVTHEVLAEDMRKFIGAEPIVCDAEDPEAIYILATHGINAVPAKKGADSVLAGIKWIQDYQIVVDIHCQNFINEIQQYHFMQDKDGNAIDKPCKEEDHLMDAMRYALEPLYLYGRATAGRSRI